jgi:hypothetical protein
MDSFEAALRYPMDRDDWLMTILVGGVLSLFSFLLVPLLPVYGYIVSVVRRRLDDDPTPPTFDNWEDLFVDGLRALVVIVAYMLVPFVVAAITVGGSLLAIATGTRGGAALGFGGLALGFLLSFVLTLLFGYIAAAALVNFVREDRLGAAFDFDTIRDVVTTRAYAVPWLLSVVAFVGASILTNILNVIPFLGAIVGAFVLFYVQVVAARLWTDGFSDALEADEESRQTTAGESPA